MTAFKVVLVGPLPPPSGGMANQTRQLAALLQGEGLAVEVVQVNAPYRPAWAGRLRGVRALFRLLPYLVRLWRASGPDRLVHILANSGWSWHLFAAPAVWIARARGARVVVNYRGGEAEAFFARSWPRVRPTLARADRVVVPSAFLERVFARRGVTTRRVPNIINLDRFGPAPGKRFGPPHLVVTRNLEPVYDLPTAIRAFGHLSRDYPQARLTVAGSGPLLPQLQALVGELGLEGRVTFTGRLDNDQMAGLYHQADLMLNSSLADNMPISFLEAMACGVPVISTAAGGIPDLVTDGRSALLVPVGDDRALAAAARRVLDSPQLADSLRREGQALVTAYTWPAVREKLFGLYGELAGPSFQSALNTP